MVDLTAIILTKNEGDNIEDCLKSIQYFAKRIVLVDSGSTDNTISIAKKYKVDIYSHKFENYARQFNWAIDNTNITSKWTLRLDADERLTPKLCKELELLINQHDNDDVNGITMEAYFYFDLPETQAVCHFMGQTDETRHIWMKKDQAVISPSWSIHSACATMNYTFIWGMAGENLNYNDMDGAAATDLR